MVFSSNITAKAFVDFRQLKTFTTDIIAITNTFKAIATDTFMAIIVKIGFIMLDEVSFSDIGLNHNRKEKNIY